MATNWRNTPHEDAIAYGRTVAEVDAALDALDAAGLLLTPQRLDEIATVVEEIDVEFATARTTRRLAAEAVRAGGASL